MARKPRVEVEGGLYHVITRGNNRQTIFNCDEDYQKFLSLLATQKRRVPFFLYAYCLMTNHVHLLIERQKDAIGRIMQRLLTGYSQYYNRRYQRVGHLLQGRHKSILCQSDRYLSELVRYIHLNPVRAQMVQKPEDYQYSSHRCYLGLEEPGIVDVDPVLRRFGGKRKLARERYREFVDAGIEFGHREEFYLAEEGRILGTEEFVDGTIHRIGETAAREQKPEKELGEFNSEALIAAVEKICGVTREEFNSPGKNSTVIRAKEALILIGRRAGASAKVLSEVARISISTVNRRYDAAQVKMLENREISKLVEEIENQYWLRQ